MKTVLFIRHAKSSWDNPGLKDFERPLNPRGLRDAPEMASRLQQTGIKPQRIITSPATRAYTTALFFATTFSIPETEIEVEEAIYHAWPDHILQLIHQLPEALDTIALFGHNPTFTALANMFSKTQIPNVPTCGIVKVEANVPTWKDFQRDTASVTDLMFPKDPVD